MSTPEDLAARIDALSPPERLRLAAGLLEEREAELAYAIIDRVHAELGAALLLQRTARTTPNRGPA